MVGEYQLLEEEVNDPEVFFSTFLCAYVLLVSLLLLLSEYISFVFLPITVTFQNDLDRFWPFATTIAHF